MARLTANDDLLGAPGEYRDYLPDRTHREKSFVEAAQQEEREAARKKKKTFNPTTGKEVKDGGERIFDRNLAHLDWERENR